jgi:hypothetical protein
MIAAMTPLPTPCLQSQIGRGDHLWTLAMAQVMAAVGLSVAVCWGPARTGVNGTLVARPARTTFVEPGRVAINSTAG